MIANLRTAIDRVITSSPPIGSGETDYRRAMQPVAFVFAVPARAFMSLPFVCATPPRHHERTEL
jgi:hypothetical protein